MFGIMAPPQRVVAHIFVRVPHPAAVALRPGRHDPRRSVAEAKCRQPALHHQAIGLRERRLQALQHHRTAGAVADAEPVHPGLQPLEIERCGRGVVVENPAHEIAHLGRPRFVAIIEHTSNPLVQVERLARPARHQSPPDVN